MSDVQTSSPVCIIGAGPAGLHAAFELARHNVHCHIIDESSKIGGVVFRGPFRDAPNVQFLDQKILDTIKYFKSEYQKYSDNIRLSLETQVLGPLDDEQNLALYERQQGVLRAKYEQLIIATGCHERAIQFPGWTLPGVMPLGGIQIQIKSGLVRPGNKIALVGTGPLLLVVAKQLHQAGIEVVGVYEVLTRTHFIKKTSALFNRLSLAQEGLQHLAYLKRAGIPLYYGWGIVEARGDKELNSVIVAPYNRQGQPVHEKQRELQADCLGIEYGFAARSQLTQLFGLAHEFDKNAGLKPIVNEQYQSSHSDIYIAGTVAGIYGHQAASEQGKIAATAILSKRGVLSEDTAKRRMKQYSQSLNQYIRFQDTFDTPPEIHQSLLELPKHDTVICRCENVKKQQIDDAIAKGIKDITSLKMATRAGMGDCQGKLCGSYCYGYLRKKLAQEDVGILKPRFPLDPIPFSAMMSFHALNNKATTTPESQQIMQGEATVADKE